MQRSGAEAKQGSRFGASGTSLLSREGREGQPLTMPRHAMSCQAHTTPSPSHPILRLCPVEAPVSADCHSALASIAAKTVYTGLAARHPRDPLLEPIYMSACRLLRNQKVKSHGPRQWTLSRSLRFIAATCCGPRDDMRRCTSAQHLACRDG